MIIGYEMFRILTFDDEMDRKSEQKARSWPGSNRRPSACEADVITTTPQDHMISMKKLCCAVTVDEEEILKF